MSSPCQSQGGFTLIELIMVIVLLGILATYAAPRLDLDPFKDRGYLGEVLAAVRYAQKVAIASGCDVQVQVSPASGYALYMRTGTDCTGGFGVPVNAIGSTGAFANALVPSGVVLPSLNMHFDGRGRPWDSATSTLISSPLTVASMGGDSVQVINETGFVRLL